jgi:hypothetical protein
VTLPHVIVTVIAPAAAVRARAAAEILPIRHLTESVIMAAVQVAAFEQAIAWPQGFGDVAHRRTGAGRGRPR